MKFELLESGREAKLLEAFEVETSAGKLTIPEGFVTDFASVPRIFWSVVPPWGRYAPAAVIHDWLYRTSLPERVSRKEADIIFLEEMKELGVPYWKRYVMYWAVRIGGGSSWVTQIKEGDKK